MARYVKENQRIPRRGEVGLSSNDIESFEKLGYVMSGSRHHRMNQVRERKEGQIYSAEEKRAMAIASLEAKAQREAEAIASMRRLAEQQLKQVQLDALKQRQQ
jgi:NF-kappa-B-activating protein